MNVESRGPPSNYTQIGILTRSSGGDLILPLMSRRLMRDKMQYYTISNTGNMNTKLPISKNGKSCTGEYGCDEIFNGDNQPQALRQLRQDALTTMEIFARFNPHLTGSVLDGTAGQYAETHIHLFADSAKDVEIFLLNQQIPYDSKDKSYRIRDRKAGEKKGGERMKVPMFTLEGPNGLIKLSVFEFNDMRFSTKSVVTGGNSDRLDTAGLKNLLAI
ncbi:MAG: hypothetical protein ACO29L_02990 [Candidatus Methylopumilus sp.]